VSVDVRLLDDPDTATAAELRRLAFGGPRPRAGEPPQRFATPGEKRRHHWGLFDRGQLVAVADDLEQAHWFGGRSVPAGGVAGVAVSPADRGRGHAQILLTALLHSMHERGAAVSTLYPTAPALYRGLGWEQIGVLTWSDLPTAALGRVRLPTDLRLRAARPADVDAIARLYRDVARAGSGYLDRPDPAFAGLLTERDGVTLAVDDNDAVLGYASWDRGVGYEREARLTVHDLIGATGPATTALLGALGSWGSVTPTLRLLLPDPDPVQWLLPAGVPLAHKVQPWMLRLVDAAGAIAARGWPEPLDRVLELDLVDEQCPWNAGRHRLEVAGGVGRLSRVQGPGRLRIGTRGLALIYAGGVTAAILRRAGLLSGDESSDPVLDAIAAGPRPAMLDYF
jgi:predicted acetyltransferase